MAADGLRDRPYSNLYK